MFKEKNFWELGSFIKFKKKEKINDFIFANGDTIFDIDINDLKTLWEKIRKYRFSVNKKNTNNLKLNNLSLKK